MVMMMSGMLETTILRTKKVALAHLVVHVATLETRKCPTVTFLLA